MNKKQWLNVRHFSPDEFLCRCGCGKGADKMQPRFLVLLDSAREEAGIPFVVTSGYRCPEYNIEVGGVSSSAHTDGYAADIKCDGSRTRHKIVTAAINAGFLRIGIHKNFIHLDCDPDKPPDVIWLY